MSPLFLFHRRPTNVTYVTFYVTFYHTSKLELLFEVWELRSAALCGAEVWLCEAVPLMRHVCREVIAANSGLVAEKRGASANFSNVSKLGEKPTQLQGFGDQNSYFQ